jgi:hypothetical protein
MSSGHPHRSSGFFLPSWRTALDEGEREKEKKVLQNQAAGGAFHFGEGNGPRHTVTSHFAASLSPLVTPIISRPIRIQRIRHVCLPGASNYQELRARIFDSVHDDTLVLAYGSNCIKLPLRVRTGCYSQPHHDPGPLRYAPSCLWCPVPASALLS